MSDYSVVCTINKSEPPYEPNVYLCKRNSHCCLTRGQPTCCLSTISYENIIQQAYPIVLVFVGLLLAPLFINWYFSDDEPPADIENESVEKRSMMVLLCPNEEDNNVEDPLFGKVYEESVSRKAYVDAQPTDALAPRRRTSSYRHQMED